MKFIRKCPKCGHKQSYTRRENWRKAIRQNRKCGSCCKVGRPTWNKGKVCFVGKENPFYGKHHTDKTKKILREQRAGKPLSDAWKLNIGKGNSIAQNRPATKRKLRISAIRYIEKYRGKLQCNVGKNETQLLDEQEKKESVKILRQWNTGLGYVADGYCPETNTIYEVYEHHHATQIQKDLERETEICNHFGCNFVIIWDK